MNKYMSKGKTYNSLEDFAKGWKKENPVKSTKMEKKSDNKKVEKIVDVKDTNNDDGTYIIRIPV